MRTPLIVTALLVALTACPEAGSQPTTTAPKAPAAEATPKAPAAEAAPAPVAGPLGDVLATYDEMQRRFAKDDAATGALADQLARSSAAASAAATGATKQALADLAAAATKLAEQMKAAPAPAIDVQRKAFADLSKLFVALLVADPSLQKGRFIFECPMAPSYKKWVQTHGKLQNPWYGSKMLECGEKADWSV